MKRSPLLSLLRLFTDRRFDAFDVMIWIFVVSAEPTRFNVSCAFAIWLTGIWAVRYVEARTP